MIGRRGGEGMSLHGWCRGRRPAFHYLLFMEEPSEIPPWERGLEDLDTSAVDLDTLISLFKERPPSELGKNGM